MDRAPYLQLETIDITCKLRVFGGLRLEWSTHFRPKAGFSAPWGWRDLRPIGDGVGVTCELAKYSAAARQGRGLSLFGARVGRQRGTPRVPMQEGEAQAEEAAAEGARDAITTEESHSNDFGDS